MNTTHNNSDPIFSPFIRSTFSIEDGAIVVELAYRTGIRPERQRDLNCAVMEALATALQNWTASEKNGGANGTR